VVFARLRQYAPPCNTCFPGLTRVHNGISIGLPVFAGLTIVTDRPTDRPRYSVCNHRPHGTNMHPRLIRVGLCILIATSFENPTNLKCSKLQTCISFQDHLKVIAIFIFWHNSTSHTKRYSYYSDTFSNFHSAHRSENQEGVQNPEFWWDHPTQNLVDRFQHHGELYL